MSSRTERANAIRALAMDSVELANSGHPGAPMGLADVAEVLWRDAMKFNPKNSKWWNRDRFVLSNGHASMLLYAALHLTGYDVSINDLKKFRRLHSKTAGHPEYGDCDGVETTTGPLGQGFANSVGFAFAEKLLAKEFNRPQFNVIDHHTWVIVGDGCLMEGISHEAASLAGTLGLEKLIALYDDNGISIDGKTEHWFSEDVPARFEAYGWRVIRSVNGHDGNQVQAAIDEAKVSVGKPTLICCQTIIGYGAPGKSGSASSHGSPLGNEEITGTRQNLNWTYEPFDIPVPLQQEWDMSERGAELERDWLELFDRYQKHYPEQAAQLSRRMSGALPDDCGDVLDKFAAKSQAEMKELETRKSSGQCLNLLGPIIPELLGGSADLTGSNNTQWDGAGWFHEGGRYVNYGVREFGMTAIANGIALHGGLIPYTGTFLVFMEYARNAVRLAALMRLRNIFVYSHDSVGLGEDGPTHQPIEQLTNLRTTPNLSTWRPCDTVETVFAWKYAITNVTGPTAIVLTRQKTSAQFRDQETFSNVASGGYVIRRERTDLDLIIIASGSEVELATKAAEVLFEDGIDARVVSMPSPEVFEKQDSGYRQSVLPDECRTRIAVEAAHADFWRKYVGLDGQIVGINRFGLSGPGKDVMRELGITVDRLVESAQQVFSKNSKLTK